MTHHGYCIWITGLPSAGKTTIARELKPRLQERGWNVELLDGDEVRRGLSADLGFDRAAREQHAERVSYVAKVLARNGVISIVALISPYRSSRARASLRRRRQAPPTVPLRRRRQAPPTISFHLTRIGRHATRASIPLVALIACASRTPGASVLSTASAG